jgi:hypothetical protein
MVEGEVYPIYTVITVTTQQKQSMSNLSGCIRTEVNTTEINCDPMKEAKPYCTNGVTTREYEITPFTGSGACLDVIRTISSFVEAEIRLSDQECREVNTRCKIDDPATCAVTQRFTYHYWMSAHSLSRTSP